MLTRARRIVLISLAVLLFAAGGGAVALRSLYGDRTDYSQVVSIEREGSYQDASLLAAAWQLPVARLYGPQGIEYQKNPSFCGPTAVVNVCRSLGLPADPSTVLDGTGFRTVFGLLPAGLTLDEEAELLRTRTGHAVTVLRDLDLAAFRREIARANDPALRYVVNFTRGPLFGRGGGHHSPVGGYLAERDLVLIVDVNRGFRAWLAPVERLWAAVNTVDPSTKKTRGLLRVEASPSAGRAN